MGCDSLRAVFVEDGCKADVRGQVGESVTVVRLPDRDTMVGDLHLWDLRALRSVAVPEGVEAIGDRWFAGSLVEDVRIPSSVTEIGAGAFYACSHLKAVVFAEDSMLEKMGKKCFCESGLEEVTIPRRVVAVDSSAFRDCRSLRVIRVEDGCTAQLSGVELPGAAVVGPPADCKCIWELRGQKNAVVPEGTERVGNYWFWESGVEIVEIPASVREIGVCAFQNCGKLRRVEVAGDGRLERLEEFCFSGSAVEEVSLPAPLREIGWGAFRGCDNLRTVWADPSCAADIRRHLRHRVAILPLRQTTVGGQRLWDLRVQKEVVVPEGIEEIGNYWFASSDIESVLIPASVRNLGTEAFRGCRRLRRVELAEGSRLEAIGKQCFCESGIEEIALPAGLKEIGKEAFFHCSNLKTVEVEEGCAAGVEGCVSESVQVVSVRRSQALSAQLSDAVQKQLK